MKSKLPIILAVLAGVGLTIGTMQLTRPGAANAEACSNPGVQPQSHTIMIMNSKAEPANITGRLCDTVTINNMDNVAREITFGPHENHVPYDGVSEKVLNLGQSFTLTLNKTDDVHFHDHLHDEVDGHILVIK